MPFRVKTMMCERGRPYRMKLTEHPFHPFLWSEGRLLGRGEGGGGGGGSPDVNIQD